MDRDRDAGSSLAGIDAPAKVRKSSGTVRLSGNKKSEADQSTIMVDCPVCNLKNPHEEKYCADCGFLLSSPLEDSAAPNLEDTETAPHLEDASGRCYTLRPGVNTLGRESTDILLPDRSVSRYHGTIVYDEERGIFSVEDTGSTNGSTVNGEPLPSHNPRSIRPGDQLSFGNIVLRFAAAGNMMVNRTQSAVQDQAQLAEQAMSKIEREESEPVAELVLLRGAAQREFLLEKGVNTIGRHPDNTICVSEDRYISGHHCKIEVEGDLFLLVDLGSTNGTFLNGLRMTTNTSIAISEGDEILVGGLLLQFHKFGNVSEPVMQRTLLGAPTLEHLSAGYITPDTTR